MKPGPEPAVLLFKVPPAVAIECDLAAQELQLTSCEIRHLESACRALAQNAGGLLIAGAVAVWDRVVIEEHAAKARVEVCWLASGRTMDSAVTAVRRWGHGMRRDARR